MGPKKKYQNRTYFLLRGARVPPTTQEKKTIKKWRKWEEGKKTEKEEKKNIRRQCVHFWTASLRPTSYNRMEGGTKDAIRARLTWFSSLIDSRGLCYGGGVVLEKNRVQGFQLIFFGRQNPSIWPSDHQPQTHMKKRRCTRARAAVGGRYSTI